ncbi:MAG TPA: acetyl/propionyl/methylcrotonyl-CoA carboxylase subunit alpha [Devosiaceae bacterium]
MFKKILIANRGEIACRVIASARRLGVATVAVYSDADAGARHVAMADEAVRIGEAAAIHSYLSGERIVAAALDTGAQAIHPGYGFLSENPGFVDKVEAAGLTFIGPPETAIRAMGLKDAAKALMEKAGVPVVPGYHGASQDADTLEAEADRIGYPVLIKARAGGGGKGMRLVERREAFREALASARREAEASFGDPACLIEKYITRPRHIEMQVFGDSQGNIVHLFERDCSLQRRHQKVIEEAPAPGMPEAVREAMGQAAVEAARAIGYVGAGTVEFIADTSRGLRADGFWFMEMNTRLQVEHPVTEAITGLDLVELQLRVAAGEPLPFGQEDLKIKGHAIEARLYAEDADRDFMPATGQLSHLSLPEASSFSLGPVRVDSGVREGDVITPYYDPMIAKLIVHGPNRASALNRLGAALAQCHVAGVVTNAAFLGKLVADETFVAGMPDTGLIGREMDQLVQQSEPPPLATVLAAIAALGLLRRRTGTDPFVSLAGWRQWSEATQFALLETGGKRIECAVTVCGDGHFRVELAGESRDLRIEALGGAGVQVDLAGRRTKASVAGDRNRTTVFIDGGTFVFDMPDHLDLDEEFEAGGDTVIAPMPGQVRAVLAEPGQQVGRGDTLAVLEAMKMEYALVAPRDGTVGEVLAEIGQQVAEGELMLRLVPQATEAMEPAGG